MASAEPLKRLELRTVANPGNPPSRPVYPLRASAGRLARPNPARGTCEGRIQWTPATNGNLARVSGPEGGHDEAPHDPRLQAGSRLCSPHQLRRRAAGTKSAPGQPHAVLSPSALGSPREDRAPAEDGKRGRLQDPGREEEKPETTARGALWRA